MTLEFFLFLSIPEGLAQHTWTECELLLLNIVSCERARKHTLSAVKVMLKFQIQLGAVLDSTKAVWKKLGIRDFSVTANTFGNGALRAWYREQSKRVPPRHDGVAEKMLAEMRNGSTSHWVAHDANFDRIAAGVDRVIGWPLRTCARMMRAIFSVSCSLQQRLARHVMPRARRVELALVRQGEAIQDAWPVFAIVVVMVGYLAAIYIMVFEAHLPMPS